GNDLPDLVFDAGRDNFQLVLNDLINAIRIPHITATNCSRVVEGIRHLIAPNQTEKAGWAVMRAALNVDEAYLKFLSQQSYQPRHGNHQFVTRETNGEILRRAWTVMDRYIHYRKRADGKSLPESEFPLLKG